MPRSFPKAGGKKVKMAEICLSVKCSESVIIGGCEMSDGGTECQIFHPHETNNIHIKSVFSHGFWFT